MSDGLDARIRAILKGIDAEETADDDGWWEASSGAKYGAEKLRQVIETIQDNRSRILEEAARVCDSVNNFDNPMTAGDCAELIRALAAKPAQEKT